MTAAALCVECGRPAFGCGCSDLVRIAAAAGIDPDELRQQIRQAIEARLAEPADEQGGL